MTFNLPIAYIERGLGRFVLPLAITPHSKPMRFLLRGCRWIVFAIGFTLFVLPSFVNAGTETSPRFWSFQAPTRHPLPGTKSRLWAHKPIDLFILVRLEEAGLDPSPPAARWQLVRRVAIDLTGLPPNAEEVDRFLYDTSPDAYQRLVERLLASPHFGERWARMWLDVARYAEDQAHIVGDDKSLFYPNAYLYRDWVIQAWNQDMPYDRFLEMQLAADLIEPQDATNYAALGFLGLGPKYYGRGQLDVMADEWEDRVDTVTRGLLGLTVACARCHDHKYDPIPTEDYYALAGVFASSEMFNRPLDDERTKDEKGQAKSPDDAIHMVREATPTNLNVFIRGDVNKKGDLVPRHFLTALCPGDPKPFEGGSGRRELAAAIADAGNPLTARVFVNRVWAACFGQPLVATPSNFGSLGEPPTHPELLDDLAARFAESGWSLKWLLREMVLSATYQQASQLDPAKSQVDPANRLLWRMNRRRLDVESWRDAILSTSGQLDAAIGGSSMEPHDPASRRRTIYSRISRLELNKMLALFDHPDPNAHSERRTTTTTPLQKLFVLNSPFMVRQATAFAERLLATETGNDEARIHQAYRLAFGRAPSGEEIELAVQFLEQASGQPAERWRQFTQVLLASNEMMFVD